MRTIGRVFVAGEDSAVGAQIELATAAENSGLEGIWVRGPAAGHSDSYATTAAAAIASVTTDLRIGVVLDLTVGEDVLRLAEDLAVLDQCSSGRAEICLECPRPDDPNWYADARRLITNLRGCAVGDRRIAVTPGPLQPEIPAVTRGALEPVAGLGTVVELGAAAELGAGRESDGPMRPWDPDRRVVLHAGVAQTRAVLSAVEDQPDLGRSIKRLRATIDACSARDLVFVTPAEHTGDCVGTLASVIAPLLRANEDEVPDMVLDVLKFRRASSSF